MGKPQHFKNKNQQHIRMLSNYFIVESEVNNRDAWKIHNVCKIKDTLT